MADALFIAMYGSVNVGKSSLINALTSRAICETSAIGGATKDKSEHLLETSRYERRDEYGETVTTYDIDDLNLTIIDTPGITEAGDVVRHEIALEVAREAHLVLFVVAGDLTNHELLAVHELFRLHKPMILVVNQIDKYDQAQLSAIRESINKKVARGLGEENIVYVSASPVQRMLVIDQSGQETWKEVSGAPDVTVLRERIDQLVEKEGHAILSLQETIDALMIARADSEIAHDEKLKELAKRADKKIENFAVGTAITVAINPVPLLDLAVGAGGISVLVMELSETYGTALSEEEVKLLASELKSAGSNILAGSTAAYFGGSLLKMIPGVGTFAGGVVQAGAVGYVMTVLGETIREYLSRGKTWDAGSLSATLDSIVKSSDKASITGRIVDRVKKQMVT